MMPVKKIIIALLFIASGLFAVMSNSSCGIYKFNEATIPDSIKTVKINFIENKARYVNPQLSPQLTDRLRQKITGQTKLVQTNSDNFDWEISGKITDYSLSTSAISGQQTLNNRITVGVSITLVDRKTDKKQDFAVSRSFEFKGNMSLQQAEAALGDEMLRTLADEIFNKLFSNW